MRQCNFAVRRCHRYRDRNEQGRVRRTLAFSQCLHRRVARREAPLPRRPQGQSHSAAADPREIGSAGEVGEQSPSCP